MKLILTCEHAGNVIPEKYKPVFEKYMLDINSHKGIDFGAFDLFKTLKPIASFTHYETTSRLLIELNRSLHNPKLFSSASKSISTEDKNHLIETIYNTYRLRIIEEIETLVKLNECVLHLSIHTFTPVLNSEIRNCDIGLLYDPKQAKEKEFSKRFKLNILSNRPNANIRFNYPYKGYSDGLTTYLRKVFPENYLGIELEVNQKFTENNLMDKSLKQTLYQTLKLFIAEV